MYLGKEVNDSLLNPPYFSVERTWVSTSSCFTGNGYVTNYDNVLSDNYGAFSGYTYTVPLDGVYFFIFCIDTNSLSIGDFFIRKNGSTICRQTVVRHSNKQCSGVTQIISDCSIGDTINVYLDYYTTNTNNCRYGFGGFLKRGSI